MIQWMVTIIDWGFVVVSVASLFGWIWLLKRWRQSGIQPVQPLPRTEPFWSLAEFFLMFGLLLVCTAAAATTARRYWGSPDETAMTLAEIANGDSTPQSIETLTAVAVSISIANILVLVCMFVQMGLTRYQALAQSGLWPSWDDIRLGGIASVFILPPVMWLAALLEPVVPYKHNAFELIQKNPVQSMFWAMALGAVVVAPVFEEFMFRMLLQGGGERLVRRSQLLAGRERVRDEDMVAIEQISSEEVASWSWWPVVVSSVTFSLMHLGQGAAPIPLFFFAFALGYLYRQTGRLWPCICVHLILNSISLVGFILQVLAKGESP
jgi:membrane protease YdiL (CAAX protease family)